MDTDDVAAHSPADNGTLPALDGLVPVATRHGWMVTVAQPTGEPITVEVVRPTVRDGAVRAVIEVRCADHLIYADQLNLTSAARRTALVTKLGGLGITLTEFAVLALDRVCRAAEIAPAPPVAAAVPDEEPVEPTPAQRQAVGVWTSLLLDQVATFTSGFIVFASIEQRTAVALWILHTHALRACPTTPYLHIHSPQSASGKTRLLEVLELLTPRAWRVIDPSEPVLFRKIARDQPTLLLDEIDGIFAGPKSRTPTSEGLRQVLNAGYRIGGAVPRCVKTKTGFALEDFPVFSPKAICGLRAAIPDTVASRSIPIALCRRTKAEPIARFRLRDVTPPATGLRTHLADWTKLATPVLCGASPTMPDGLSDRAEEIWEPLVAIADLAGHEWPERARAAALALNGVPPDNESVGIVLLRAIAAIFEDPAAVPSSPPTYCAT